MEVGKFIAIIFKTQEGKGSTFGFSFPRSKLEIKTTIPKKEPADIIAS
jgi:hypothetical protein